MERNKYTVEPHIPAFADFAAWKGKRVLELGCGLGTETTNFARAGATVVAVDISRVSLDLLRQRLELESLSASVTLVQGDCEEVDKLLHAAQLDKEPFDLGEHASAQLSLRDCCSCSSVARASVGLW